MREVTLPRTPKFFDKFLSYAELFLYHARAEFFYTFKPISYPYVEFCFPYVRYAIFLRIRQIFPLAKFGVQISRQRSWNLAQRDPT